MGAEQSSKCNKKDEEYQKMMQRALEQQRLKYEEKCREMLQQQAQVKAAGPKPAECNTPQKIVHPPVNYAPLYPNLQQNSASAGSLSQPSTSSPYYQHSSTAVNQNLIPRPFIRTPLVTQSNAPQSNAAHYNVQRPGGTVSGTGNTFTQSKQHPSASLNFQPSAPPEASSSSQKVSRERTNRKPNVLGEAYKCPTCKNNYLEGNIFQCEQGHSSCNQCKIRAFKCGTCKCTITDTRNYELEKAVDTLVKNNASVAIAKAACPNKNDGCPANLKPEYLQAHLKQCIFREMECPLKSIKYGECIWRGKINQIQSHFRENHPDLTGNVDTETCFDRQKLYVVQLVSMGNFNFLVHVKLDSDLETFVMAVQLIGSPNSASKWSYEFHVYEKSASQRKFMYVDKCVPIDMSISDLSKDGKCAALPLHYALSFFKQNKVTYKFYIKRNEVRTRPNKLGKNTALSVQSES